MHSRLTVALLFCSVAAGQQTIALNGPWKFHVGDDRRWAVPNFDDRSWQDYTIDPHHTNPSVPEILESTPLAGWQAHGHPGYTGYAWYRLRMQVTPGDGPVAILMPKYVDDAYEVYVDGERIGSFGKLDGLHISYYARPELFTIPSGVVRSAKPFTIALRFWDHRYQALPSKGNQRGGLLGIPVGGPRALLEIYRESERSQLLDQWWPNWLVSFLYGAVALISFFLFVFMRSAREYLWAGISLGGFALMLAGQSAGPYLLIPAQVLVTCIFLAEYAGLFAGPIFVMCLLGVDKRIWRRLNYFASAAMLVAVLIELGLYFGFIPPTATWDKALMALPVALFCVALLVLAIAVDGIRTIGRLAWAPLAPGLLGACGLMAELAGPRFFGLSSILYAAVPVTLLLVFLLRFVRQKRENERYSLDVKQVQEVQQLLLPARAPQADGFAIESIYLPAREVGGDFFQILDSGTGSLLLVFGDVAGKGLPAAMLVALLVGAIRTRAQETHDPASILEALNDSLCGTTHEGFTTCLAAEITAEGTVRIANAGQLAPYINEEETGLPGALPLGVVDGMSFETHTFVLEPGDRLTFISDGVVEAKNGQKELFGFERVREISMRPAHEIASAAKQFGQDDDITVVTIRRMPVAAYA